ncbi:MAG TPA: hypothetical protein VL492_12685 [Methylovirgula sp.]|jgi:hypothetical protein|nr:hypothetical protein [Methylovirgula sp.]
MAAVLPEIVDQYSDAGDRLSVLFIRRRHGNTLIRTMRRAYGPQFGDGCESDDRLSDVLHRLDEISLSAIVRDQEINNLADKIARARIVE